MVIDLEIARIRRELREEAEEIRCELRAEWKQEPHDWEVQHCLLGSAVQRLHDSWPALDFVEWKRQHIAISEVLNHPAFAELPTT